MKKFLVILLFVVIFFTVSAEKTSAVTNDIVKVGIKYGSGALYSANLENEVGKGYSFGYFDKQRNFVELGKTAKTKLSMTAAGTIYMASDGSYSASSNKPKAVIGGWHIQMDEVLGSYEEAAAIASTVDGGYPAYISDEFRVRIGCYETKEAAEAARDALGIGGTVVSGSRTGVMVTVSKSTTVLFEFDCEGLRSLGIMPDGRGKKAVTWFKGYKYYGGFEYNRITGGKINVVNVVNVEDYVKGVIPYEMSTSWPLAALEAQAICARTYAFGNTGHLRTYGFDVCSTSDCQVYYGVGNSTRKPGTQSNLAVDNTAGLCLYANGELINATYYSSNGGASESSENVWGGYTGYLVGKEDPYEGTVSIPNYEYTVTYTPEELTWVMQNSGYSIGKVVNVYVSEYTEMGNVHKVTVVDEKGEKLVVKGTKAKMLFYSSTLDKNARSMRFRISGNLPGIFHINTLTSAVESMNGVAVISGSGSVTTHAGENPYVITAEGVVPLKEENPQPPTLFTITGTGNGHNVGMSQHGARAMALLGMTYADILNFYYTGITIA